MNIIDSSLWLEYFAGTLKNELVYELIETPQKQLLLVICIYEVYKRMLIEKDETAALHTTSFMQNANVIDLTSHIVVFAAKLSKQHKLPMADSIIYATAKIYNAEIFTQDKHFENLLQVHYYPKEKNIYNKII